MAFHVPCYNSMFSRAAQGKTARYRSRCEAGDKCTMGGYIEAGQAYTWSRRSEEQAETTRAVQNASHEIKLGGDPITAALAAMVVPVVEAKIQDRLAECDPEVISKEVLRIVHETLQETMAMRVEVKHIEGPTVDVGVQHRQFPTLVKCLSARVNVWLAGPSGSGKTTAAICAAKALNLSFRYTGAMSDPYALMGYNDAQGRYVRTPFREAWEHGGIFLWDEVDASDPNALLAFNAALANGHAAFPDGIIPRHADCILIAAANTYGHGATHEYVGRLKLDAAFLKRFAFIAWEYDETLESATGPNMVWTKRVQAVRAKVKEKGLRVLVTPRETYIGAQLLAAGIPQKEVENMTIRSGMTEEQWKQVG